MDGAGAMAGLRLDRAMRREHPSLWRAILLDVVILFLSGFGYAFTPTPKIFSVVPVEPVGVTLILVGMILLYGWRNDPRWYAIALASAAGCFGFLSLSVLGAIIDGYRFDHPAPSLGSLAVFVFVTCQFLIQSGEPHSNPASEAMRG